MSNSTLKFASAHDHWHFHPAVDLVIVSNWRRHLPNRHPVVSAGIEWGFLRDRRREFVVGHTDLQLSFQTDPTFQLHCRVNPDNFASGPPVEWPLAGKG